MAHKVSVWRGSLGTTSATLTGHDTCNLECEETYIGPGHGSVPTMLISGKRYTLSSKIVATKDSVQEVNADKSTYSIWRSLTNRMQNKIIT